MILSDHWYLIYEQTLLLSVTKYIQFLYGNLF